METKTNSQVLINPYGIKIRKRCLTCKYFDRAVPEDKKDECNDNTGLCTITNALTQVTSICDEFSVKEGLMKAGRVHNNSSIKEGEFFKFLLRVNKLCSQIDSTNNSLYEQWRWYMQNQQLNIYQYWKREFQQLPEDTKDNTIIEQINSAHELYTEVMGNKKSSNNDESI